MLAWLKWLTLIAVIANTAVMLRPVFRFGSAEIPGSALAIFWTSVPVVLPLLLASLREQRSFTAFMIAAFILSQAAMAVFWLNTLLHPASAVIGFALLPLLQIGAIVLIAAMAEAHCDIGKGKHRAQP